MAQVEHYPTDHHLPNDGTSLIDDPTQALTSTVPSRPGPELDSKYHHSLPEPPQFTPPKSVEELDPTEGKAEAPIQPASLEVVHEDRSTYDPASENLGTPLVEHSPAPEEVGKTSSMMPHQSIEGSLMSSAPEEAAPEPSLVTEPTPQQPPEEEEILDQPPEHSSSAPTEDLVSFDDHLKPSATISTTDDQPSAIDDSLREPEPESMSNVIEDDSQISPEVESVQLPPNGSVTHTLDEGKLDEPSASFTTQVDDWTDLTRSEVQFSLCLFALPWSSLLLTLRTLNQLWYFIFDWHLVRPTAGLLTSIIAPSLVYTSLIASLISFLSETPNP